MHIYKGSQFVAEIKKLAKPKFSHIYGSLDNEIEDFFREHHKFEQVWVANYMLFENLHVRVNKIRLENRNQNSGKSGGFRLITICDNRTNSVGLVFLYPKTGPLGMANTPLEFLKKIVKAYSIDKKEGKLELYKPSK